MFLAIDLGTTSVKVALVDEEGQIVARARREVSLRHPQPTWAEVDAGTWRRAVFALIRKLCNERGVSADDVTAVGLTGLMHAVVPVSSRDCSLDAVMLWMDQRCAPQAQWLTEKFGDRFLTVSGSLPHPHTSAAKMRWLVENKPDVVRNTFKFLLPKDYLCMKLTGAFGTDTSDAGGTALFDRAAGGWSEELLHEVGIAPGQMPAIRRSTDLAGHVTAAAAAETGLREGTPVVVGASDVRTTLLGANAFVPHRLCLYVGTAAWWALAQDAVGDEISVHWLGATSTTGAVLRWFKDNFGAHAYEALDATAADVPAGAEGLIFLPHLMGERAVTMNPRARGVLFGLTLAHSDRHVLRAVYEGCAYQLRHILDVVEQRVNSVQSQGTSELVGGTRCGSPQQVEASIRGDLQNLKTIPSEAFIVGGGAKSALWQQIIADVTDKTLLVPREPEAGLLGAAMCAAVGVGRFGSLRQVAHQWVTAVDRQEPNPDHREVYTQAYRLYRELDEALERFWNPLKSC